MSSSEKHVVVFLLLLPFEFEFEYMATTCTHIDWHWVEMFHPMKFPSTYWWVRNERNLRVGWIMTFRYGDVGITFSYAQLHYAENKAKRLLALSSRRMSKLWMGLMLGVSGWEVDVSWSYWIMRRLVEGRCIWLRPWESLWTTRIICRTSACKLRFSTVVQIEDWEDTLWQPGLSPHIKNSPKLFFFNS